MPTEPQQKTPTAARKWSKVDAYCHFAPPALLDYLEKATGQPHPFRGLFRARPILTDAAKRVAFMDAHQLDASVLIPLPWLETAPVVWQNAARATEAARLCNNEIAKVVQSAPDRFFCVALLPTTDPQDMVRELDRAVDELGFVGGLIAVGPTARRVDDERMAALWERAAKRDVPIWLHPSRPINYPDYVDETVSKDLDWQTMGWLHDTSTAMTRIVFAGLFDKYPNLKIVTHHHGALIPLFAGRMEAGYRSFENDGMRFQTPISRPYTAHFKKFYCDTATFSYEPLVLQQAFQFFDKGRMLFGTDTPMDATPGEFLANSTRSVNSLPTSKNEKARIFAGNFLQLINRSAK